MPKKVLTVATVDRATVLSATILGYQEGIKLMQQRRKTLQSEIAQMRKKIAELKEQRRQLILQGMSTEKEEGDRAEAS